MSVAGAQVRPPCVRGCSKQKINYETGEIVDEPKPATVGHLCGGCAEKLHQWLTELPDLVAMLDPRLERGDIFEPGRRGKISGSPALVRLDVEAMLDPRSVAVPRRRFGNPNDQNDADDPVVKPADIRFGGDVPGVLCQWADCLCDDLNIMTGEREEERPKTLVAAVELLTGPWWGNVAYMPWIDELYTEVHEIRAVLRNLNNLHDPVPVGDCSCGKKLFLPEDGSGQIKCRHCGHRMDGMAIVRLKAAQTISEASA